MAAGTQALDTIWEVDDALWSIIEAVLLAAYPPKGTGRPRADWRKVFNAIIFRMRTGCQWNKLPKELGSDSTAHRWFQQWVEDGVFEQVWAVLVEHCDEFGEVQWDWQAADAMLGKARFGGMMSAPTPRIERKTVRKRASSSTAKAVRWPR